MHQPFLSSSRFLVGTELFINQLHGLATYYCTPVSQFFSPLQAVVSPSEAIFISLVGDSQMVTLSLNWFPSNQLIPNSTCFHADSHIFGTFQPSQSSYCYIRCQISHPVRILLGYSDLDQMQPMQLSSSLCVCAYHFLQPTVFHVHLSNFGDTRTCLCTHRHAHQILDMHSNYYTYGSHICAFAFMLTL